MKLALSIAFGLGALALTGCASTDRPVSGTQLAPVSDAELLERVDCSAYATQALCDCVKAELPAAYDGVNLTVIGENQNSVHAERTRQNVRQLTIGIAMNTARQTCEEREAE